jgi:outer membrane protease
MKNIPPFSVFVILLFLGLGAGFPAHGEVRIFGRPYAFTLSPQAGVLYGTLYEIVYQDGRSGDYLSELQWDQKPLWFAGVDFSFGPRDPLQGWGFFAGTSLKVGIPAKTGDMEDRDWMPGATKPGSLTHFSSHDNHNTISLLLNLNTGFSFPLGKYFFIKLPLSLDYYFFMMEARNGYTQYGNNDKEDPPYDPWNPDWEKKSFSGTGIKYSQHWFILSPGVSFGAALGRFTFSASFKISPLVACIAVDDHLAREILFTDIMIGGLYLEPALEGSFRFNEKIQTGLGFSYRQIRGTRGDQIYEDYGEGEPELRAGNAAGAGLQLFEGKIFVIIRL